MTTETCTEEISSRSARGESAAHWRCPAPDGVGGKCFRQIPCNVHSVDTPHIGMLLFGSSFFVPDGEVPQEANLTTVPSGWQPMGYLTDEEPYVDEQLSKWAGMRVVVDPSLPPHPGWELRHLDVSYRPQPWESGPAAYPHPETGRLASIAPWLTFDADGRTLD